MSIDFKLSHRGPGAKPPFPHSKRRVERRVINRGEMQQRKMVFTMEFWISVIVLLIILICQSDAVDPKYLKAAEDLLGRVPLIDG